MRAASFASSVRRAVNLSAGLNRMCAVRTFSEFYEPYPNTRAVNNGHYLVSAAASGDEKTVVDILDSGIDPNCRGEQNETALMIAAENNIINVIMQLLKRGANVNLQDDLGETALMKASRESHKEVVKILLDNGAQADVLNYEHMTAREATLDVEVDEILSSVRGAGGEVSIEEHATVNMHAATKKNVGKKDSAGKAAEKVADV